MSKLQRDIGRSNPLLLLPTTAAIPVDEDCIGANVIVVQLTIFMEEFQGAAETVHAPRHLRTRTPIPPHKNAKQLENLYWRVQWSMFILLLIRQLYRYVSLCQQGMGVSSTSKDCGHCWYIRWYGKSIQHFFGRTQGCIKHHTIMQNCLSANQT